MSFLKVLSIICLVAISLCVSAQDTLSVTAASKAAIPPADTTKKEKKSDLTPFFELISDEAISMTGMLTVHRVDDKYYFEIPDSLFGREIMAITRMAKTPTGAGYGGEEANEQVIRFERGPNNKVFIRGIDYVNVSTDTLQPIYKAIQNSNVDPIIAHFSIKSVRPDTSVVIDVTDFLAESNQAFSLPPLTKQRYKLTELQKDRSYLSSIRPYPINLEIRSVKTFGVSPPSLKPNDSPSPYDPVVLNSGVTVGAVTFELNTSLILLPKVPMRKRFYDPRVGYFATGYTVFADEQQRAEDENIAVRWRLEPKNAADAAAQAAGKLIEPAKPIVFYIDPATPFQWRQYLKQGVEDWKPAFEQAGWKNAIMAKDWPENDTTMSLEDARFSVIRYFASDIQNAYGPNVSDPRSGEILESHIGWYHNVMQLLKNWYTVQAGAVDPNSHPNDLDPALMGKLVRFVAAHEVGHTLGLRHNFGASNATPVEKLRDKAFVAANGHTSSIMDYARFNYVAQPEDGVTDLFPRVGDYDRWAIEWGYKYINSPTAEQDKKILNKLYLSKAANNPRLRFLTESSIYDPRAQSEDLGDNPMIASAYGIKNLQRIVPNIATWTKEEAEGYARANELYDNVFGQYRRYINHNIKWVGGMYQNPKTSEQQGSIYEPVSASMQRDAVKFVNEQLFQTPSWLLDPTILPLIKPQNSVDAIAKLQESTLNSLFQNERMLRIIEGTAIVPTTYNLSDLFQDMRVGIWAELYKGENCSIYRRNLQKIHLEKLINLCNTSAADIKRSDIPSVARAELVQLRAHLTQYGSIPADAITRAHLLDCAARIDAALDIDKK